MFKEIGVKMKDVELVLPLKLRNLSLQVHLRLHLWKTMN